MTSYDAFATTFSNSRKNMKWAELDTIIEDVYNSGYTSILDIGCGNGRLLDALHDSIFCHSEERGISFSGTYEKIGNNSSKDESKRDPYGMTKKKQVEYINYLGIDNSSGMIDEARKLHGEHHFEVCDMLSIKSLNNTSTFDAIILLASFHHLEKREERIRVLRDIQKFLSPNGSVYMTNWNLREQSRYEKSHRGNGDFDIKIGEFSRYYHGFTLDELIELFTETGWDIVENRVFEGGKNIYSKVQRN